ncbi:hypothetical protein SCP_0303570 [Sparassis crispa]|uniref:Copia protein n=1 Tax=Sparassis crispa TaxID=139825 RepID=A0A401GEP8_9APHY|nr:hypothetical protein SCP_0303570 [Sparassis crispa]GBE80640.1 hypothetical protein SCP_0303570 [Sparassis crispa]
MNELVGYKDTDWARDVDTRRSVSAYVFQLGNSSIAWSSKRQMTIASLSTESEYMALSYGAKQALWYRRFLTEIGLTLGGTPTALLTDNMAAKDIAKDTHHHGRTKHIDVQHHFICERIQDGNFNVVHCPTAANIADGLTKPLDKEPFSKMVSDLGLSLH